MNSRIERIEVHNNDKYDGLCHINVDIYFSAVGIIDISTEKEICVMREEIFDSAPYPIYYYFWRSHFNTPLITTGMNDVLRFGYEKSAQPKPRAEKHMTPFAATQNYCPY